MNFNRHSDLVDKHAFLSPSRYHWVNYDEEKLDSSYLKHLAVQKGNDLHTLAYDLIRLGVKLPKTPTTLNMYVNDAIGFRMTPEQPLFYSYNVFGTADTIAFNKNFLRIHDLKTGETPASITQLMVYAALFCLEYDQDPNKIGIELRIYQGDNVLVETPQCDEILRIINRIVVFDRRIDKIKKEGEPWAK